MEKIWLKSYPQGIPAEIDPDANPSIVGMLEESCQQFHDRPAFYNLGVTITYGQLDQYTRAFAAYLQQALQLQQGDRIAIMLPNVLQYPIAMFGALRAGLIVVNVNPLYTPDELVFQLQDSGAETILVLENFAHTVEKVLQRVTMKNVIVCRIGDFSLLPKSWLIQFVLKYVQKKIPAWHIPQVISFKKMLKQGARAQFQTVTVALKDIAFLQYTGGTTGLAKGAILTHRNIMANIAQAKAWIGSKMVMGEEIIITALPLYHIFSLLVDCLLFVKLGGFDVLITNPRDIPGMIKEMAKFKFTTITGVNTLFWGLLKNSQFSKLDFSALKLALGGGMAVQEVVAEKWQQVTGVTLLESYGLTEASPGVAVNPVNLTAYNGSIGLPFPSTDVAILDEDGHELAVNQEGELAIKGPQVMQGYWNQPKETQKAFTKEGWLLTGDIASIDEQGFLRILDRKKDMIIVSGFNVYPNEVEDVLVKLPGVREAAVTGVADEHSGEVVKAYIIRDNPHLTAKEVVRHCREHLTSYKVPKKVEFCHDLPKSNVGKILRRALRDRVVEK
ncbi:MAG: long-chain-fatty-acid--CoA ligase [Gammaproteobacteria bacterium RIFCSPHIGHO2_12_FULL_41_20]|nr:MAG: long-chain-fatty-acid--CoA ligase [Gammaproteobacteria bacterium RIFCSPHIGHO2_12_FULL_41_20]